MAFTNRQHPTSRHMTNRAALNAPERLVMTSTLFACCLFSAADAHAADLTGTPHAAHHAQGRPGAARDSAANAKGSGMETIHVRAAASTSRRQALAHQNDPVSVTTVTEKDLQSHQITNLQQAQKLMPSVTLQVTNPRNTAINIRGLGNFSSTAQDGLENGTAVYIDGVYQTRPGSALYDISDLSGFEVLKGPQATRGGVDNDGGMINITTAAPSFKRQYSVTGDYGSYNTGNIRLRATGAIGNSDKVAYSISGFSNNRDGYIKNVTTGRMYQDYHDIGVKGQILANPTDRLSLRLIADYTHMRGSCCVSVPSTMLSHYANGAAIAGTYAQRAAYAGATAIPAHSFRDMLISGPGSQAYDQESYGVSLNLNYRLAHGWQLENIAAWRTWYWYPHNAYTGGTGIIPGIWAQTAGNNQVYEQHATEELRISSPENRPWQVSGGVFYMYEAVPDSIYDAITPQGAKYYGYGYSPAVYNAALNGYGYSASDDPVTNSLAGYVRAKYQINRQLTIEGGFRYSFVTKSGGYESSTSSGASFAGLSATDARTAATLRNSMFGSAMSYRAFHRETEPSGSLSLVYRPSEAHLLYATYSRGVRNGGINVANLNVSQGANPDVKPELNDMFEFGVKNAFFNKRLLVNASAFWNNVHNYITSASYYTPTGTIISYLTNAKHVVSRGFELDARGTIAPGLEGRLSAAYTDAFYASFRNATQPLESSNIKTMRDLSGNQIPLNSKWNLSAGLEYTIPFQSFLPTSSHWGSDLLLYIGGDYTYRSSYYADPSESAYTRIAPYGLFDAHIGARPRSGKWDVSFWGHNMLDKRYFITMTPQAHGGMFYGQLGDPAMFGGEFTYHL